MKFSFARNKYRAEGLFLTIAFLILLTTPIALADPEPQLMDSQKAAISAVYHHRAGDNSKGETEEQCKARHETAYQGQKSEMKKQASTQDDIESTSNPQTTYLQTLYMNALQECEKATASETCSSCTTTGTRPGGRSVESTLAASTQAVALAANPNPSSQTTDERAQILADQQDVPLTRGRPYAEPYHGPTNRETPGAAYNGPIYQTPEEAARIAQEIRNEKGNALAELQRIKTEKPRVETQKREAQGALKKAQIAAVRARAKVVFLEKIKEPAVTQKGKIKVKFTKKRKGPIAAEAAQQNADTQATQRQQDLSNAKEIEKSTKQEVEKRKNKLNELKRQLQDLKAKETQLKKSSKLQNIPRQ